MALRHAVQPLDRTQDQMAVGRVCHRLGLHGGVHRDPLQLALTHGLGLHSHRDRFGQQGLQITRADPLTPAGH